MTAQPTYTIEHVNEATLYMVDGSILAYTDHTRAPGLVQYVVTLSDDSDDQPKKFFHWTPAFFKDDQTDLTPSAKAEYIKEWLTHFVVLAEVTVELEDTPEDDYIWDDSHQVPHLSDEAIEKRLMLMGFTASDRAYKRDSGPMGSVFGDIFDKLLKQTNRLTHPNGVSVKVTSGHLQIKYPNLDDQKSSLDYCASPWLLDVLQASLEAHPTLEGITEEALWALVGFVDCFQGALGIPLEREARLAWLRDNVQIDYANLSVRLLVNQRDFIETSFINDTVTTNALGNTVTKGFAVMHNALERWHYLQRRKDSDMTPEQYQQIGVFMTVAKLFNRV